MGDYIQYIIPILAITMVAGGWAGVQLLAKKMQTKNHIDQTTGCCGNCNGENCTTQPE